MLMKLNIGFGQLAPKPLNPGLPNLAITKNWTNGASNDASFYLKGQTGSATSETYYCKYFTSHLLFYNKYWSIRRKNEGL